MKFIGIAGFASSLVVTAPSEVAPGDKFVVTVTVKNATGSPVGNEDVSVQVTTLDPDTEQPTGAPAVYKSSKTDGNGIATFVLDSPADPSLLFINVDVAGERKRLDVSVKPSDTSMNQLAPQSTFDFGMLDEGQHAGNSVLQSPLAFIAGQDFDGLLLTTISADGEGFVGGGALFQDAGTFTYNIVGFEASGPPFGLGFDTFRLKFLRSQNISDECPFILSAFGDGPEVDRIEVTSIPDNSEFFWNPEHPAGDELVFIMSSFGDTCPPNTFVGMTGGSINEPPPVAPNVVGLVPLGGQFLTFPGGQPVHNVDVTVSLYMGSGSGGVVVPSANGLPDGCLGVDLFNTVTQELLAHYVNLSSGGCDALSPPPDMVDGPWVLQNNGYQVQINFGGLPGDPFNFSLQFNDPGDPTIGTHFIPNGVIDPSSANDLANQDFILTHAEVDELISGGLSPVNLPQFGGGGGLYSRSPQFLRSRPVRRWSRMEWWIG